MKASLLPLQATGSTLPNAGPRAVGRCTLVGAGPGDPELLTLKAVKAIASASVLVGFSPPPRNVVPSHLFLNSTTTSSKKPTVSAPIQPTVLPPPILLKLTSDLYKSSIFKSKRDSLPGPTDTEKASGIKRFDLVEDLTPATRSCLLDLRAQPSVDRAWTNSGEIRFVMKNDTSSFVHKVKSPFLPMSAILPATNSTSVSGN